jgi:phosphomethylpyrimidine synthase
MTQVLEARSGKITKEMEVVSKIEGIAERELMEKVSRGLIVIPKNKNREIERVCGIGDGLRTKVNANIGTSTVSQDIDLELKKARVALDAGADTIMDLSTGGDLTKIRRAILNEVPIPLGTVPIYQAAIETAKKRGSILKMTKEIILDVIHLHGEDGVDFLTLHCGLTQHTISRLKAQGRLMDVVSRGGAFLLEWMIYHRRENPLYESFDEILKIAKEFDLTLSLGDGMRPGAISDASDRAQIQELLTLGELTKRAHEEGVQVMIEGPGHLPLHHIEANVEMEKCLCHSAPFYVLGPLVSDIAPGYDHVTSAIGGAIAAWKGADFLCYVTRGEHLHLPREEDVREGVLVTRIAAHAADIAKGIKGARDWDDELSRHRKELDWDGMARCALDPAKVEEYRETAPDMTCSMCGDYCALKIVKEYLGRE